MTNHETSRPRIFRGFRVHGRVQGVGFRWWTRRTAEQLGVAGSVRNLSDGTVEVLAAGSPETLDELERRLRKGPGSADVRRVERFDPGPVPSGPFRIER